MRSPARTQLSSPVEAFTFVKDDGERFLFTYDAASRDELLRKLGQFASTPGLSFSWYDAAFLGAKLRGQWDHEDNQNARCAGEVKAMKCSQCKRRFPIELIQPMTTIVRGELQQMVICPLCALENRNAIHGLPPDTPFEGPMAAELHRRAVAHLEKQP